LVSQLGMVAPVVLPPCMLLGALFPLTTRLLQTGPGGPATGHAYALNTLGTIAGSLLTGFVLLTEWGVQGVVLVSASLAALLGFATLLAAGNRKPKGRTLTAAVVLAAVVLLAALSTPRWDPVLMSLGTYRPFHAANVIQSWLGGGGI